MERISETPKCILERRTLLIKATAALAAAVSAAARADEQQTSSMGLVEFTAASFSLRRPETWEQIDKPGAEVLFRDPNRHR